MELHHVNSTALSAIGYDRRRRVLEARFRSTGRIYHYFDVPASEFQKLLAAPSIGRHFNAHIRPHYRDELVYDPHRPHRG